MEGYETLAVLGEGTYGVVIKARHRATGQLVAIKKFKQTEDDDHVRKTSLREVRVLKQLHHPNVVALLDVFRRDGKLYLVFEHIEHTILQLLECTSSGLPAPEVRKYMYQLLRGLDYCHAHNIIHRDVKPENILVSYDGVLKLCDFGFARHMTAKGKYTDYVATRWYRPPELLVGEVCYGKAVDVWAVGCILAELTDSQPLFPGDSDLDQLSLILKTCGAIPPRMVHLFERNPLYRRVSYPNTPVQHTLQQRFPTQPPEWVEFLSACLSTDPDRRPSCAELMNLPYFTRDSFRSDYEAELRNLVTATLTPSLKSPPRGSPHTPKVATTASPKKPLHMPAIAEVVNSNSDPHVVNAPSWNPGTPTPAVEASLQNLSAQALQPTATSSRETVPPLPSISPKKQESTVPNPINERLSSSVAQTSKLHPVQGLFDTVPQRQYTSDDGCWASNHAATTTATESPTPSLFPQLGVLWTQYLGNTGSHSGGGPKERADSQLPGINPANAMLSRRDTNSSFNDTLDSSAGGGGGLQSTHPAKVNRTSPAVITVGAEAIQQPDRRTSLMGTSVEWAKPAHGATPSGTTVQLDTALGGSLNKSIGQQRLADVSDAPGAGTLEGSAVDGHGVTPRASHPHYPVGSKGAADSTASLAKVKRGTGGIEDSYLSLTMSLGIQGSVTALGDAAFTGAGPTPTKQAQRDVGQRQPLSPINLGDLSTEVDNSSNKVANNGGDTLGTVSVTSSLIAGAATREKKGPPEVSAARTTATQMALSSFRGNDAGRPHYKEQLLHIHQFQPVGAEAPAQPARGGKGLPLRKKKRTVLTNLGNSLQTHVPPVSLQAPHSKVYGNGLHNAYVKPPYVYPPNQQGSPRDAVYGGGGLHLRKLRYGPGGNHGNQQDRGGAFNVDATLTSREVPVMYTGKQATPIRGGEVANVSLGAMQKQSKISGQPPAKPYYRYLQM